jgi:hypothetical protein
MCVLCVCMCVCVYVCVCVCVYGALPPVRLVGVQRIHGDVGSIRQQEEVCVCMYVCMNVCMYVCVLSFLSQIFVLNPPPLYTIYHIPYATHLHLI